MSKKIIIFKALACCIAYSTAWAQPADNFPVKPIRIIIPFPPGGGTDSIGRAVAAKLQEAWGQPVLVDNQAGANGTIGLTMGMKAAPDGYTLTFISTGTSINPHIYPNLTYNLLRDFMPLTQLSTQPYLLVVHPSLPVKSVKELIALAKAQPGMLNYGSSGLGGTSHLACVMLESISGTRMTHVPYKGSNPALQDLLAGNIQVLFSTLLQSQAFVRTGRLRAIAISSKTRSPTTPELPTVSEAGAPGFEVAGWFGLALPARTPQPILARLHREIARIMHLPDIGQKLAADGSQAVGSTPEDFTALIKVEIAKWGKIVKEARIKIE